MKKLLTSLKNWFKDSFTDSQGEASSKRQLMAFLVLCLGAAFLKNVWHPKELAPSPILVDAVVTVICFLGGATVGDKIAKMFDKKKDDENPSM